MYNVKLYNKIAKRGLSEFDLDKYTVSDKVENEDAIVVRSAKLHDIELNPNLKAIARAGAGTNNIPIDKCSEQGIVVFNTPGANANAVKELVIAGLLVSARPIYDAISWAKSINQKDGVAELVESEKSRFKGTELSGKTLGVIGLGAIGIRVANLALHLGMEVIGYDPFLSVQSAMQLSRNVKFTKSLDDVYRNCDYITIHVPLTKDTKEMIDVVALGKMKKGVHILNFARGGLVDEEAMSKALDNGKVANYVVDFPSAKMIHQKNCICIPHLGASTPESEENCAVMAVHEVMDFLENGNITNSVNLPNAHMDRGEGIRITVVHRNVPNMLAQFSQLISNKGYNIENMMNKSKGNYAYTIIDTLGDEVDDVIDAIKNIDAVLRVNVYK